MFLSITRSASGLHSWSHSIFFVYELNCYNYRRLNFILYAFVSGNSVNYLITETNRELFKIPNWLTCSKETTDVDKTHYVIFNRNETFPSNIDQISINNKPIRRKQSAKFLGLALDRKLNWKEHACNVQTRINKQSGILYHTRTSQLNLLPMKLRPNNLVSNKSVKHTAIDKSSYYMSKYDHMNVFQEIKILETLQMFMHAHPSSSPT